MYRRGGSYGGCGPQKPICRNSGFFAFLCSSHHRDVSAMKLSENSRSGSSHSKAPSAFMKPSGSAAWRVKRVGFTTLLASSALSHSS